MFPNFQIARVEKKIIFRKDNKDKKQSSLHSILKNALIFVGKGKVCIRAHQAGAYPGFCSMKRLGVFLLPPGWDASPSEGYPPALSSPVPTYTPGWREAL